VTDRRTGDPTYFNFTAEEIEVLETEYQHDRRAKDEVDD
jgi:hypothetical protein